MLEKINKENKKKLFKFKKAINKKKPIKTYDPI